MYSNAVGNINVTQIDIKLKAYLSGVIPLISPINHVAKPENITTMDAFRKISRLFLETIDCLEFSKKPRIL